jgi:hypothetical protein
MKVEEAPKCMHQWTPHQGRPVTSLFFLDNLADYRPEIPCWKYAITATEHNSELKVVLSVCMKLKTRAGKQCFGSGTQCCGSGSARIRNFLQDPDPDPHLEVMDPDPKLDLDHQKN